MLHKRDAAPTLALFARPEGLGVTIHVSKRQYGVTREEEHHLQQLASDLNDLSSVLQRSPPTAEVRKTAARMSNLFRQIHDYAEEIAAQGRASAPKSDLVRAIAGASDS